MASAPDEQADVVGNRQQRVDLDGLSCSTDRLPNLGEAGGCA